MEVRDAQSSGAADPATARGGGSLPSAAEPIPEVLPILPLPEMVLFPGVVVPLAVSRPASLKLLDDSLAQSKVVGLFTQREASMEEPGPSDIHEVGVAANVAKLVRQADGSVVL